MQITRKWHCKYFILSHATDHKEKKGELGLFDFFLSFLDEIFNKRLTWGD